MVWVLMRDENEVCLLKPLLHGFVRLRGKGIVGVVSLMIVSIRWRVDKNRAIRINDLECSPYHDIRGKAELAEDDRPHFG
jgi:hypothetical protein